MKKCILLFFVLFSVLTLFSQSDKFYLDSLENIIHISKDPNTLWPAYYYYAEKSYRDHPERSLKYLRQAVKISSELDTLLGYATCNQLIGVIMKNKGNSGSAIYYYLESLAIYEQVGSKFGIATTCNDLGVLFKANRDFQKAEVYYKKAFSMVSELGHKKGEIMTLNNIGTIKKEQNEPDSANYYYKQAYEIARSINLKNGLALTLNNLGELYLDKGEFQTAKNYFLETLEYDRQSNDAIGKNFTFINLALTYNGLNQFNNSIQFIDSAIINSKLLDAIHPLSSAYKAASELYQSVKQYDKALEYFKLYSSLKDSIFNEKKSKQLAELNTKYETEKKEQQLQLLTAETQLQTLEIQQTRNLVFALVLLMIFSTTGIILYNSRKRYKLKAQMAEEKEQMQKARFKAVIDAEENERKRIARELHDGLGQILSTARITVSSVDEQEENRKVQNSLKLIDHAVDEVRNISHNMMPNALVSVGLDAALNDIIRKINQSDKINVAVDRKTSLELEESKSIAVYRVFQEVMNNALKYADASEINISIDQSGPNYEITIRDNGKGFDVSTLATSKGIGWSNIQSRIELIGGDIHIFSRLAEGTTIKFTIPQHERAYQAAVS